MKPLLKNITCYTPSFFKAINRLKSRLTVLKSEGGLVQLWGGGTQTCFERVCAAQASKPLPIFKDDFGRKGDVNNTSLYFSL